MACGLKLGKQLVIYGFWPSVEIVSHKAERRIQNEIYEESTIIVKKVSFAFESHLVNQFFVHCSVFPYLFLTLELFNFSAMF